MNFVKRYEGRNLERAHDLFEEVLSWTCPEDPSKAFYLLYAQLEEKHETDSSCHGCVRSVRARSARILIISLKILRVSQYRSLVITTYSRITNIVCITQIYRRTLRNTNLALRARTQVRSCHRERGRRFEV